MNQSNKYLLIDLARVRKERMPIILRLIYKILFLKLGECLDDKFMELSNYCECIGLR